MSLPEYYVDRDNALLASYALRGCDSLGRKHAEPEQTYRSPFVRDRDRLIHSTSFRRLSGKMQVFTGDMGDYHRTRLTHTHEVSCIARTLARALRLNEDLVEALALFHDIGHPPFGHSGEDALAHCLRNEGGFSHNRQALVIAEELERPYAAFLGLNLTLETLESQATRIRKADQTIAPYLEAQTVEAADSLTYDAHDVDDSIKLGLISLAELEETSLVREAIAGVRKRFTNLDEEMERKAVARELLDCQIRDILPRCSRFLDSVSGCTSAEVRKLDFRIGPSPEFRERKVELERLLFQRVYRHEMLLEVRKHAQERIVSMFEGYTKHPDLMPKKFQTRAEQVGLPRAIADFIAGMTDRYCDQQFSRHFCR